MGKTSTTSKKKADSTNGPAPQRVRRKASAVERTALLTHDTKEKRGRLKLQLHLRRTQRSIDVLRQRLEQWDPVAEEEEKKKMEKDDDEPKKKRPKWNAPETWKLKGAARPAWLVYDFDTRYVDPHIQAHERAKEKRGRLQNLLKTADLSVIEPGREFLSLLMQYGHLNIEAKRFSTAREAFLECMALDKTSATTAADALISMYMQVDKHASAVQLGLERDYDTSVCLRFSTALAAHCMDHDDTKQMMEQAVCANVLCGLYLANINVFETTIECVAEIEELENTPLEEALEYCDQNGQQWKESGASQVLQSVVLGMKDIPDWETMLSSADSNTEMYATMFRTAMDIVSETKPSQRNR